MNDKPDFSNMTPNEARAAFHAWSKELSRELPHLMRAWARHAELERIALWAWEKVQNADVCYGRN